MTRSENAPVTVLFTDLAGSDDHDGRLGHDRAAVLRRRHSRLIRDVATEST